MSTTNNTNSNNKLKRKRIFKEITMQGEIVAKSYVDFDFRKAISSQIVMYSHISYTIVDRFIVIK